LKSKVIWNVKPCSSENARFFEGTYFFHLLDGREAELHGVTTQKTVLFIVAVARATNPKMNILL
jgi:hypothetical protein